MLLVVVLILLVAVSHRFDVVFADSMLKLMFHCCNVAIKCCFASLLLSAALCSNLDAICCCDHCKSLFCCCKVAVGCCFLQFFIVFYSVGAVTSCLNAVVATSHYFVAVKFLLSVALL